jgi:threonine dehydrogenase-like Zn-dependent dehydrogenase
MRAARLHGVGDLRLHEEPAPRATAGMSLVRVTAVGICGSDLRWWDEGAIGDATLAHPLVLGHEGAGVLEPLGVALHSVDLGHLRFGGTASVVGCGPIGLLLIGVLKAAGASSVLAVEPLAHRREAAARRTGLKVLIEPLRRAVTLGLCVRCGWRRWSTFAACWRS